MNYFKGLLLLFVSIQLVYGDRGRKDRGAGIEVGGLNNMKLADRIKLKFESIKSNCDPMKSTRNDEVSKILVTACITGCNSGFDSDSSRCHEVCSGYNYSGNVAYEKVCMTACNNCKFKNPVPIETQSGVEANDKPSDAVGVAPFIQINSDNSLPDKKGTEESKINPEIPSIQENNEETNEESSEESKNNQENSSSEESSEEGDDDMGTLLIDSIPPQDRQNIDNNGMMVGDSSFTIQQLFDLFDNLRGLFRIGLVVGVQDEDSDGRTDTNFDDVSNDELPNIKGLPFELPSIPVEEQFPFYRYRVCYPITFSFSTFCRDINNIFNCASIHSGLPRWFFVLIVLLSSVFMMWLGFFFLSMIKRMRKQPLFIDRTDGYLPLYKDIDFQIETRIEADPLPEKQKLESI